MEFSVRPFYSIRISQLQYTIIIIVDDIFILKNELNMHIIIKYISIQFFVVVVIVHEHLAPP